MSPGKNRKKLVTFVTAGYPTASGCLDLLRACAAGGADAIELGIPFSDPLADGPVIQATSQVALERGSTMDGAFKIARKFRGAPLLFMTYLNPVLQYNPPRFFSRSGRAGLAGVIIPDLPVEEADPFLAPARMAGVPIVFLCSPTTTPARLRLIDRRSRSWIYLVSLKGVTGAALPKETLAFIRRVRRATSRPLYVGFGISTPEQARFVAREADGVIVGSALLKIVQRGGKPRDVERFVASLRKALG